MTDGSTEVTDLEKTDANKALVRDFTQTVLIGGDVKHISDYHAGDRLIQHDPLFGDGTAALAARVSPPRHGGAGPVYGRLHLLLGQSNMVLAVSEGVMIGEGAASRPAAFYDLYRIEGGAIGEHWDVVEITPPCDTWKNGNGKF